MTTAFGKGRLFFFPPKEKNAPAKLSSRTLPTPPRPRRSWAFLAGKIKFDQEKSYETVYKENVPEKPLRIHHDKLSSIISVAMMGIFP
jgi:hypothetical protein